jgi:signal transduction histidine kinase
MKFESTRVAATFERPETALPVAGNRGEIRQALLNLLLNAIQAMPGGGEIRVAITVESGPEGRLGVIRVADNGPGIPESIRERLFESFLTSRSEGTGLGLSIVKRILRGHEGDIVVEKSDSAGTTFLLTVPLAE